jgi:hypothetical protein
MHFDTRNIDLNAAPCRGIILKRLSSDSLSECHVFQISRFSSLFSLEWKRSREMATSQSRDLLSSH